MGINSLITEASTYVKDAAIDYSTPAASKSELVPEGVALGRLVAYIEYGPQTKEFQGVTKIVRMFQLGFALWGGGYEAEDGSPIILNARALTMGDYGLDAKSNAFKVFQRMRGKTNAKHFSELLGQAFRVPIVHGLVDGKPLYANIDLNDINPAFDPIMKRPDVVPQLPDNSPHYRLFLWDRPSKLQWDSLYIDGVWEAKPATATSPAKPEKSKNVHQERIKAGPKFKGSAIEALLLEHSLEAVTDSNQPVDDIPDFGGFTIPPVV